MQAHGRLVTGQELTPIYNAVGNFIVGCCAIEFQTYVWIEGFCAADRGKWRRRDKPFSQRKVRVMQIVAALPLDQVYKTGAGEIWADAVKVMEFRNVIAHNPVIFRLDGPDADVCESVRIPSIKDFADGDFPDFSMAQLREYIGQADDVNRRLESYRGVLAAALGVEIKIEYKDGDQSGK